MAQGPQAQALPQVSPTDLINPLLSVEAVMTPNPRTCGPYSSVVEAALVMRDADCGLIPITDAGQPVGVVTDRDLALALAEQGGDLSMVNVGALMNRDVVTINADATLDVALERLGYEGVRRLLVVDAVGLLRGVLSWTDLIPHITPRALGNLLARIVANR